MKKTLLYSLLLIAGLLASYACKEKKPPVDLDVKYVLSAEVVSPEALNVKVDNFARFIAIDFADGTDVSGVRMKILPAAGTTLEDPKEEESVYNLTQEAFCKLRKDGKIVVFRIKPHFVDVPIDDMEYIRSVEVLSPESSKVQVDNSTRSVTIDFAKGTDVSNVRIKITPGTGIILEEPQEEESTYNLTQEASCKLRKDARSVIFRIKPHFIVMPFDPSPKGWEKQTAFGELPAYLSVYKYNRTVNNKKVQAYMAVADLNDTKARFTVLGEATGTKTPSQFFESSDKPKVVLNAGYFWDGHALGLMVRDGQTVKQAQTMAWRPYNGTSTVYYPTQGAFGVTADGRFEAHWAYHSAGKLYVYPAPAPNKAGEQPQPIPTDKFPAGARPWEPKTAIGAGPLLIKDGAYKNLWEAELLDNAGGIGPTISNPRSAIAYHPNGYVLFFVCEGRNKTPNTPGLSLKEVADLFLDLDCSQAINLDGGGSSCMLVNGKETILPSDGKQRAVTSMVALY